MFKYKESQQDMGDKTACIHQGHIQEGAPGCNQAQCSAQRDDIHGLVGGKQWARWPQVFLPPLILLNTSTGKLEDKDCTPNKCRDNIKLKKEEMDMPRVKSFSAKDLDNPKD